MADEEKLKSLAYRIRDLSSLRNLFAELNYEFVDEPVNKQDWSENEKNVVTESRIIAKKDDYLIYYIQTNTDSLKEWKSVATRIIKQRYGLCLVCSHNPSGFKWVFSSISKEFSKSFSETRHIPVEIRPDSGVPKAFLDFLEKIEVKDDNTTSIAAKISEAFDNFAVQIHDELTINVFEALKVLTEGIVFEESNKLELSNETLEKIREPIFILLYRIMFVLYTEDRGIFPIENKVYHEKFSLKWLKHEWLLKSDLQKKLKEYEVEERLRNLFRLIELGSEDFGYKAEEFFMRSYYGRLFDKRVHQELEEWKIPNKQMLEAISLLTRTRDKRGNYFFLDYAALETRHLGSIYEHLLEYHLAVKDKKIADLPDPKERKSSGSYYTPDYIVNYIVENTVGPVIDHIIKETKDSSEQIEKILSINILDPAMGSGHFLVATVKYIAKRICEIEDGEINEQKFVDRKRDVARRCIYGVDINPLAVDLAMVSLWLETLSSEKPLSFLSAHLKCGNSLIGSKIETLFDKQTTLMESQKGRDQFRKAIKDFLMFEHLEDDSASAVKTKMEKYRNIQSKGTIYYDLKFLLDCKTAESFRIIIPAFGDYKAKIGENSLDFFTNGSLQKVKELATTHRFFPWELEFPDIFYDERGEKRADFGFDVIIGNPPYISNWSLSKNNRKNIEYLNKKYSDITMGHWDLYIIFIRSALSLLKKRGLLSFIVPSSFSKEKYGKKLRELLVKKYSLISLNDFGAEDVFEDVARQYNIFIVQNNLNEENITSLFRYQKKLFKPSGSIKQNDFLSFHNCTFRTDLTCEDSAIKEKILRDTILLGRICCVNPGVVAHSRKDAPIKFTKYEVIHDSYSNGYKKYLDGRDISRYNINWKGKFIDYDNNFEFFHRPKFPELFERNKIIVRGISGENNRLVIVYDDDKFYTNHNSIHIILWNDEIIKLQNPGKINIYKPYGEFSILYLTGILGSKLISHFFSKFIATGTLQGTFSAVYPEDLRKIPIKNAIHEQQEEVSTLIKKIILLNKRFNETKEKKTNDLAKIEDEIREVDNRIDELIYEIYGITGTEKKIIERSFQNQSL